MSNGFYKKDFYEGLDKCEYCKTFIRSADPITVCTICNHKLCDANRKSCFAMHYCECALDKPYQSSKERADYPRQGDYYPEQHKK